MLNHRITPIYNALKSSDSSFESDQSGEILVRKLRGQGVSDRLTPEGLEVLKAEGKELKQKSSSQMGFDTRLDNFEKLVRLLSTIPEYNPNEHELKVEGLKSFYNDLMAKNASVVETQTQLSIARTHRYNVLLLFPLFIPIFSRIYTILLFKAFTKVFCIVNSNFKCNFGNI